MNIIVNIDKFKKYAGFLIVILFLDASCIAFQLDELSDAGSKYQIEEKTITQLSHDLNQGKITSEQLVRIYLNRIEEFDKNGPKVNSVLSINPRAIYDARQCDKQRKEGKALGLLHGIPVLLKDNIESADLLPTTAGSLALAENQTDRDAPIVARLRSAGAVILGKSNLSEWANIRSTNSTSGWSAIGGLTRNPYSLDYSACGSSSGSAAAVAANFTSVAVGTETDGSIICPSSMNGIVGLKPTVGLLSRRLIVPISHTQDTPGPMARTVRDVAIMLKVMAGTDKLDAKTNKSDQKIKDYPKLLNFKSLIGVRLGVLRPKGQFGRLTATAYSSALDLMRKSGAILIEIEEPPDLRRIGRNELIVLLHEFKFNLNNYLSITHDKVKTKSLKGVIAFNNKNKELEMPYFGQELFIQSQATAGLNSKSYLSALKENIKLAGKQGIDRLLDTYNLDAIISPSTGPSFKIDLKNGDSFTGAQTTLAAVAGYPHLTVPMGYVSGLPVGISFIGGAWSEAKLLSLGYAFEQKSKIRIPPNLPQSNK